MTGALRVPIVVSILAMILLIPVCPLMRSAVAASPSDGLLLKASEVIALQQESGDASTGRYDWGASVMREGDLYRMWWVRLGGGRENRFPYKTTLPSGRSFEFTYPDWGDRIFYAESRDGKSWFLSGEVYAGPVDQFSPDSPGPLMVMAPAETGHERHHVGCPSVIKADGTYYMYYEAPCEYIVREGPGKEPAVVGEYHNQVFVATSDDARRWRKHPDGHNPLPIIEAPIANKQPGRQRYGLGQPSVFYRNGTFVMHYVDSCTGPGDFIVRLEADNPFFVRAKRFRRCLASLSNGGSAIPQGAVARFAQTDVKYLRHRLFLLRPAYGTGNLNILATQTGLFVSDADATAPRDVFPQLLIADPRGGQYRERLFPRFLTSPTGEILVENGRVIVYYASGLGFKAQAHTWDIQRAEIPMSDFVRVRP